MSTRSARALAAALAGVALVTSVACTSTAGHRPEGASVPVGSSAHTVVSAGRERTYQLYRPVTLPSPAALVVVLHGGFGTGAQAEQSYGWDALAEREHVVIAYPDGLNRAWNVGGGCCGESGRSGVDDVGFVGRVVEAIRRIVPIDPRRVFATGISNGGLLSYRLACDTTTFAAIGPVAATQLGECPRPAPTSVIHIHGTADENIRFDGGQGTGVARIDGPSVPSLIAAWRVTDECAAPTTITAGTVSTSSSTCADGRAVELVTIAGAGHQWPGGRSRTPAEKALGLDEPSHALDATATIWQFFAAHPRPA